MCPEGEIAIGGGASAPAGDHEWSISVSTPFNDPFDNPIPTGWHAVAETTDGGVASADDVQQRSLSFKVNCAVTP